MATIPDPPSIYYIKPSDSTLKIYFNPPANDGGVAITSYIATTNLGDIASNSTSPIIMSNLLNEQEYIVYLAASNSIGISSNSPMKTQYTVTGYPDDYDDLSFSNITYYSGGPYPNSNISYQSLFTYGDVSDGWGLDLNQESNWKNIVMVSPFEYSYDTDNDLIPDENLGIDSFNSNDIAGKCVVIQRGTIPFSQKAYNAQQAGASMVIIYNNNIYRPNEIITIGTGSLGSSVTIPTLMLNNLEGHRIVKQIRNSNTLYTKLDFINGTNNEKYANLYIYTNTSNEPADVIDWVGRPSRILTDLIPNSTPNSFFTLSTTAAFRNYQFLFSTNNINHVGFFFKTYPYVNDPTDLENIIGIYKYGNSNNLLLQSSNFTNLLEISLNSSIGSFEFQPSMNNITSLTPNAILSNLEPFTNYLIISKTLWNDSFLNPEIGIAIESVDPISFSNYPLTYIATQSSPFSTPWLFHQRSWVDLCPDLDPLGNPLSNPNTDSQGFRTYKFKFNSSSNSFLNFYFFTNQYVSTDPEIITGIYKSGVPTNLLLNSNSISPINYINHNSSNGSIAFNINSPNSYSNLSFNSPNFILNNIDTDSDYFIIITTGWNDSSSLSAPFEVGVSIENIFNNSPLSIQYIDTQNSPFSSPWSAPILSNPPGPPDIFILPDAQTNKLTFYYTPTTDGGSNITSYFLSSITHNCNVSIPLSNPGYFTLSSLSNATEYIFQIAASNSDGLGPYSQYLPVQPGDVPPDPNLSSISGLSLFLSTNSFYKLNIIPNSTINTPPIKYFVVNSIRNAEDSNSPTCSSLIQNIFTTDNTSLPISLNPNFDWKVNIQSVTDTGYSFSNTFYDVPFNNESAVLIGWSSITDLDTSLSFHTFTSEFSQLNTSVFPSKSNWSYQSAYGHNRGFTIMFRNIQNPSTFQSYFINSNASFVYSSIVFSTSSSLATLFTTPRNAFRAKDYFFYPINQSNIGWYSFNWNTSKDSYGILNESTITDTCSDYVTSNTILICRSTSTDFMHNLYEIQYKPENPENSQPTLY
jgi:hypothetical protein